MSETIAMSAWIPRKLSRIDYIDKPGRCIAESGFVAVVSSPWSVVTWSAAECGTLLSHDLDLLVDDLPSKPVDRHVYPVMLFPFDDEIVLQTSSVWLVMTGLRNYVD